MTFEWPSPIGVAVTSEGRLEAVRGQELPQRLEHEQRLAGIARGLGVGADEIVGGKRDAHAGSEAIAAASGANGSTPPRKRRLLPANLDLEQCPSYPRSRSPPA